MNRIGKKQHSVPARTVQLDPSAGMNIVLLGPQHVENVLTAVPEGAEPGSLYLLIGDPAVPGLHRCALVVVAAPERTRGGLVLVGAAKQAVQINQTVDLLGFAIRELYLRVQALESAEAAGLAATEALKRAIRTFTVDAPDDQPKALREAAEAFFGGDFRSPAPPAGCAGALCRGSHAAPACAGRTVPS